NPYRLIIDIHGKSQAKSLVARATPPEALTNVDTAVPKAPAASPRKVPTTRDKSAAKIEQPLAKTSSTAASKPSDSSVKDTAKSSTEAESPAAAPTNAAKTEAAQTPAERK